MTTKLVKCSFEYRSDVEVTLKPDFTYSEMHGHDFYELDIILSGENTTRLNKETLVTGRGDVYFLTPEDFHEYSSNGSLNILNVQFKEDLISRELLTLLTSSEKRHFAVSEVCFSRIERLSDLLLEMYTENSETGVISRLVECILLLLLSGNGDGGLTEKTEDMQKAIVYINAHFKENPSLKDVAATIPLNHKYFCKKFKEYTGESYKEYLRRLKLRYARRLLLTTSRSMLEIAEGSGYATQSHFNREFKELYGVTPRQYKGQN